GLLTEVNRRAESKVPVLGDVPVFGYLFKRRSKGTAQDPAIKENITILVTPTILNATHHEEFEEALERVRELAAASIPGTAAVAQPAAVGGGESGKQ
ncbi:MAG: type II and III secretion system protein, partial [Planctomycetota bacterium]|nr:type II and III secretion system protein [Planctomycetota bacterium]